MSSLALDDQEGASPTSDAFVSYARRDQEFVRRLSDALQREGLKLWVDAEDIPTSTDWRSALARGIEGSRAVIVVLSPDAIASQQVGSELVAARECGKRIIPVVHRDPGS